MSEDAPANDLPRLRELAIERTLAKYRKLGAKLRYRGAKRFWLNHIAAAAERELQLGDVYSFFDEVSELNRQT